MRLGHRARFGLAGVLAALAFATAGPDARGQASDAALRDRVAQLVERLDSDRAEAREAAEKALLGLGPKVLPLLPDAAQGRAGEALDRVRASLAEQAADAPTDASTVTLKGKGIRLSEAVRQLQSQTGNPISDVREVYGVEATNPSLDLDLEGVPFLEALDKVAAEAGIGTTPFTEDGTIGLMAGEMGNASPLVRYAGPFRVSILQVAGLRDFTTGARTMNIQVGVAWEPRLRPMLLALKGGEIEVVDDRGNKVEPPAMGMMQEELAVRPENPGAEINLELGAPDRAAQAIARLKIAADVTIPAGLRTFKFPDLSKPGVTLSQGEIAVTLEECEVEEHVWKVRVRVAYPGDGPVFESYRQGLFNNRLWLQRADGSRFEHNGGFSNTASDGGRLGFEYLFVDAPGKPSDYGFVYETPSRVITIPLEAEFADVPLP